MSWPERNAPTVIVPQHHRADNQVIDYNRVQLDDSMTLADVSTMEFELWLAKRLTTRLVKLYPNIEWEVIVDTTGGQVIIKCPDVSAIQGFHVGLNKSVKTIENMLRKIGGEILERGHMPRSRITEADVEDRTRTLREEVTDLDNN